MIGHLTPCSLESKLVLFLPLLVLSKNRDNCIESTCSNLLSVFNNTALHLLKSANILCSLDMICVSLADYCNH